MKFLFPFLFGMLWMFRGSRFSFGNYPTAIVMSLIALIAYNYTILGNKTITINVIMAGLALAVLECILGYGEATSALNQGNTPLCKELWIYLGLISMCYALFPILVLGNYKSNYHLLTIALGGALAFPMAKWIDIYLQHVGAVYDTWKVAEFLIGFIVGLIWVLTNLFFMV